MFLKRMLLISPNFKYNCIATVSVMKKKVLITGSSGYVGYVLSRYFSEKGVSVVGIDVSKNPVWKGNENFQFYKCDIRDKKNFEKTLKEFENIVGLKYLFAFHLNDSKYELGSRKDRHESLGKGKIGIIFFKMLMAHRKTKNIPKYLETPFGEKLCKRIIK